jgi:hypothetical protein
MVGFRHLFLASAVLIAQLGTVEAAQCIKPDAPRPLSDADLRTVAITKEKNPGILDADEFSLAKTLDKIISTAPGRASQPPTAGDREAFLETLLEGLRATTLKNDAADIAFKLTPDEPVLTAKALLDAQAEHGMRPVGLFNRIDLAPQGLENCGEYRIVYAKTAGEPGNLQRFFLIFEAALPNPWGKRGCQQVAALWRSLKSLPDDEAKQALLKFYYSGGEISPGGLSFEPVIHYRHFGSPWGQVRSNRALQTVLPWHLRQWIIGLSPAGPTFNSAPIGNNPVPAYFGGPDPEVSPGDADKIATLRESFQNEFLATKVRQLTSIDAKAAGNPVTAQELITGVGIDPLETRFDAVQSLSGPNRSPAGPVDSPTERADSSEFSAKVAAQISKLELDCGLTPQHVLNRMGALSCGGCHHFSNNKEIAPGIRWPSSREPARPDHDRSDHNPDQAFVHIDENGNLSELLLTRFLPVRAEFTSKAASGNFPNATPTASADVVQKYSALRGLLESAQGRLEKSSDARFLSEIESLSIDLRRSLAQEPGAFVMFRKPD